MKILVGHGHSPVNVLDTSRTPFHQKISGELLRKNSTWTVISLRKRRNLNIHSLREKCPNTGKYGREKTPYLDTFQAVIRYNSVVIPITNLQFFLKNPDSLPYCVGFQILGYRYWLSEALLLLISILAYTDHQN